MNTIICFVTTEKVCIHRALFQKFKKAGWHFYVTQAQSNIGRERYTGSCVYIQVGPTVSYRFAFYFFFQMLRLF